MSDKRRVNLRILPDGRVRIHFFVRHEEGPITTPSGVVNSTLGAVRMGGTKGFLACQPDRKDALPQTDQGIITPTPHSDDGRAVTCPECIATNEFRDWMALLDDSSGPEASAPPAPALNRTLDGTQAAVPSGKE